MAEARRSEGKPLIRRRVLLNKRGGMGTVTKKMQKEGGLRFGPIFVPVEPKALLSVLFVAAGIYYGLYHHFKVHLK